MSTQRFLNELKELNDVYFVQYENIPSLLKDDNASKSNIIEYVSQSAEYNKEQKRKSDELITNTNRSKYKKADSSEQATTDYEIYREVILHFLHLTNTCKQSISFSLYFLLSILQSQQAQ